MLNGVTEDEEMSEKDDVRQIRGVIDDWAAAMRAKDANQVRRHCTKDLLHFSLAPPLISDEKGAFGLEAWFDTWQGGLGYELRDLEIVAGDGVAFSHSLNHLTGTNKNGHKSDLWFRSTLGLRRVGGEWKIAHEHESVPFLMDGSNKAALDLKP
jgi:PhnB protein